MAVITREAQAATSQKAAPDSAVSGMKPLIEDIYFNTMPHTVARVRYIDSKEKSIHKLRFEIDLADDKAKSYKTRFFVGVREDERAREHLGRHEYHEYAYYLMNLSEGTTHSGSGFSTRSINPDLATLADVADALRNQSICNLPRHITPRNIARSDAMNETLKILNAIVALARTEVEPVVTSTGTENKAAKRLLRTTVRYHVPV